MMVSEVHPLDRRPGECIRACHRAVATMSFEGEDDAKMFVRIPQCLKFFEVQTREQCYLGVAGTYTVKVHRIVSMYKASHHSRMKVEVHNAMHSISYTFLLDSALSLSSCDSL